MKLNNYFLSTTIALSLLFISGCGNKVQSNNIFNGTVDLEDNSKVCIDRNANLQCDEEEPSSIIKNKSYSINIEDSDNGLKLVYETPSGQVVEPQATFASVTLTVTASFMTVIYDYGLAFLSAQHYSNDKSYGHIFAYPREEEGDYLLSLHNLKTNEYYKEGEIEITEKSGYKYTIKPNTVITIKEYIDIDINLDSLNDTWDTGPFEKNNTDDGNYSNSYIGYSVPFIQLIKQ